MKSGYFIIAAALTVLFTGTLYSATTQFSGYGFRSYLVRSNGKSYREFYENYKTKLKVRPNEEYSIVVYNPLPVRVAVAVSIDGLNSIDGKRTTLRNARKWMIDPHSSITVSGWQTSKTTLRKFVFTEDSSSFAQWKEDKDGKRYTANLGVIGVAWFWNAGELEAALNPPQPFIDDRLSAAEHEKNKKDMPSASRSEGKAGTGMGTQQQHYVTEVEFDENAGMYSVRDVLKIYYEFAKEEPLPLPFINEENDGGDYTPDMNK